MLNEALTSPDADEGIVAALVAVRELLPENGGAVQGLVDVADQVQEPRQVDRLLLVGPRADLVHADRELVDDVLLLGRRLMIRALTDEPGGTIG